MEEDKELDQLIFYINEFYAAKNITMDLFLLLRKSEAEITKGKEAIEFIIRGRISFLTHCMRDRTPPRVDYVVASVKHWTNLLKICQTEQVQALRMLDDLYQTYKKVSRAPVSQSTLVREHTERMDTNDNN
jgi:hypothetical protein